MRKRFLTVLLVLCLTVNLLPVSTLAANAGADALAAEDGADGQTEGTMSDGQAGESTFDGQGESSAPDGDVDGSGEDAAPDDQGEDAVADRQEEEEIMPDEQEEDVTAVILGTNAESTDDAISVMSIEASGICGENLTWVLEDGTLTISGTGEMNENEVSPWYGDNEIKRVIIGDGVTSISRSAFQCCSNMTSVTIPDSVNSIGEYAFYGCNGLIEVCISSIESWCNIGFEVNNGTWGSGNPLENKANLYLNGNLVEDLIIPDGVTSIGGFAFCGCSSLKSITIPESLTSVGKEAFEFCSNLTDVRISDIESWCNIEFSDYASVPLFGSRLHTNLYVNGSLVENLIIPDSVTSIGNYAFSGCGSIKRLTISDGVTSIGDAAFSDCGSLTSVEIPDSVTSIGWNAFQQCSRLEKVYISSIENWCRIKFESGTSNPLYKSYNMSSTELYIQENLVEDIVIPDSVTSIGDYAFTNCCNLKSITIPDSVTSIGSGAFNGCYNLRSITIPDSVTSIDECAFSDCGSLTSVEIPDSVTSIGYRTFWGCVGLTSIVIPDSVYEIGGDAFYYCDALTDVYYGGSEDDWEAIGIGSDNDPLKNATIHYNSTGPDNEEPGDTPVKPPVTPPPAQSGTDTSIRKISGKYHDTIANADVNWNADFGWDYFVDSEHYKSTEYNSELAKVSLALCASLESSFDSTKQILEGRGSSGLECIKADFKELSPAVAIASKSIVYPDNTFTRIFIVVLRGTTSDDDIWNDLGSGLFWNDWGVSDIESYISDYISRYGVTTENTKFLITGHSLGGACANIVARDLSEAFGAENVFAYTFATPSPYQHKVDGDYKNIYNFLCYQDNVPLCLIGRLNWYGYGERRWFGCQSEQAFSRCYKDLTGKDWKTTYDEQRLLRLHAPSAYYAYVLCDWYSSSGLIYGLSVKCPVDVWVYDSDGKPVGHIQNDKVDFDNQTDSVMLAVEDTAKYVYLIGDDTYTIKITGTDTGKMTYTAFSINMNTNILEETKVYSNVQIEDGKVFTSIVSSSDETDANKVEIPEVQLFVLDSEGVPEKEVLPDGNGTEVPIASPGATYSVTFDANGGSVETTSMDTGADGRLSNLPTPIRSGYVFKGWYTATEGGEQVSANTVFDRDTTVYAQWAQADGDKNDASEEPPAGGNGSETPKEPENGNGIKIPERPGAGNSNGTSGDSGSRNESEASEETNAEGSRTILSPETGEEGMASGIVEILGSIFMIGIAMAVIGSAGRGKEKQI